MLRHTPEIGGKMSIIKKQLKNNKGEDISPIVYTSSVYNENGIPIQGTIVDSSVTILDGQNSGYIVYDNGFAIEWGVVLTGEESTAQIFPKKIKTIYLCSTQSEYFGSTPQFRQKTLGIIITNSILTNKDTGANYGNIYCKTWEGGTLSNVSITSIPVTWLCIGHI